MVLDARTTSRTADRHDQQEGATHRAGEMTEVHGCQENRLEWSTDDLRLRVAYAVPYEEMQAIITAATGRRDSSDGAQSEDYSRDSERRSDGKTAFRAAAGDDTGARGAEDELGACRAR